MKLKLRATILALSLIGAFVLAACAAPMSEQATPVQENAASTEPAATSEEVVPVREGTESTESGTVSRSQAEQAALEAVGSGQVTWSGPEDDRGAAWEIEITRPDGTEVDVLVAADGTVIKQVDKFGSGPALTGPGTLPAGGVVSRQEAGEAALAAVGEGQVTWIGREDERGAAWEVEITRPDGTEVDVLVAADGSIIQ